MNYHAFIEVLCYIAYVKMEDRKAQYAGMDPNA